MVPGRKILIIEDERPLARALQLKLEKSGFESHTVPNGAEALKILEQERFDLAILDLIMPVMDGFQFLEELKKRGVELPVIVTSNLGQDEDKRRVEALGAIGYVVKSDAQLSQIVEEIRKIFT